MGLSSLTPLDPGATVGLALKSGALEKSDVKNVVEFLKQFCSDETKSSPSGSASGAGTFDARLLQIARSLKETLHH